MPGRVWVVDDNAAVAESLALLLQTEGLPAAAIIHADEALAKLRGGDVPAALVLDLGMPNNGNAVLEAVIGEPGWTFPVIVLTGAGEPPHKGVAGRVYKVLAKPVEPLELAGHVRRALGGRP